MRRRITGRQADDEREWQDALERAFGLRADPEIGDDELDPELSDVDPVPVPRHEVEAIVAGAVRARRRRRLELAGQVALGLLAILAVGGAAFRWDGRNSTQTLPFEGATQVVADPSYEFESRRVAQVNVWKAVKAAIAAARARRGDPQFDAILHGVRLAASQPWRLVGQPVTAGVTLEELTDRARTPGAPWSSGDSVRLLELVSAGIGALASSHAYPGHERYAEMLLGRLAEQVDTSIQGDPPQER